MADLLRQFRATQAMRQRPIDTWVRECIGPLWRPAPHLEVILRLFERMEREPILACLSMPPGAGKTETLLACLAWFMARNPGDTNAYVSYSSSVTRRKSDRAREHCLRGGWVPHDHLWGLGEWRGAANGGLIATGVGGRLTGDRIGGGSPSPSRRARMSAASAGSEVLIEMDRCRWATGCLPYGS